MTNRYEGDDGDRFEDILDGRVHDDPIAQLLDAARAPATQAELTGLDAAVAAFAGSPMLPPTAPLPGSRRRLQSLGKSVAAATITTKILAGAAAAAAVGGIAVASTSGHQSIPHRITLFGSSSPSSSAASAAVTSRKHDSSGSDSSQAATRPAPGRPSPRVSTARSAPNPSLLGLCNAWAAHSRHQDHPGAAAHSAAFHALIIAAGGIDKVDAYCAARPGPPTSRKPDVPPGHQKAKHPEKPHPKAPHPKKPHPKHPKVQHPTKPHPTKPVHTHGKPHAAKRG